MAVAYWSFERFIKGINSGIYYIINYNKCMYYIDAFDVINLSTMEIFEHSVLPKNAKGFIIENQRLKNVFNDVEIIDERNAMSINALDVKIKAANHYLKKVDEITKEDPYICKSSLYDLYSYEKRCGYAVQHVSYEHFIDLAQCGWYLKNFTIKYNDKIYLLKKGAFKSKFMEISPQKQLINIFYRYDDMLSKAKIEGKSLYTIWDNIEYIVCNKTISTFGEDRVQISKKREELHKLLWLVQDNMIKQGKTPKIILPK